MTSIPHKRYALSIYVLLGLLLIDIPANATASDLPDKPHIIVHGYGSIEKIPDIIKLQFEVFVTASSLSKAKSSVDKKVHAAISAAIKEGTEKENINASKINAAPQYQWRTKNREYIGERVSRQIEMTITKPETYNDVVNALLAAGIDRLQQPRLDFSNREALEQSALERALDDAKQQAETIANHLDIKIKGVFQIAPVDRPVIRHRMAMAASDNKQEAAPLKLGNQRIEQRVKIIYLLN